MRSIGIDIGTYGVKVVDLEVSSRSITVNDVFEVPLNSDPTYDRRIPSLEVLQEIAGNFDPNKVRVVFAIQQQHVTLRHKQFPFKERSKIVKSLPFELEDDIPFDQDHAIFEAKILKYTKNGSEVLGLATPNEFVAERINYAHDGGIDPEIISCEAAALATLFEDWSSPPQLEEGEFTPPEAGANTEVSFHPEPGKLLLHIGHERTILCAFHKGVILASRTIYFGGINILRNIQKQYSIPYAESLKGFTDKGFILNTPEGATQDQVAFSQSITLALNEFVEEVRRNILEIQTEFKVKMSHINVSGGVSPLPNLCNYLTQCFEVPCNLLKPFQHMGGQTEVSEALGARCTIALGLALEGARRPINPAVNFRKGVFSKENLSLKLFWEKWGYSLKLGGVALAALYIFAFIRDPIASTLSTASVKLVQSKAQEAGLKKPAGPQQLRKFVQDQDVEIKRRKNLNQLQDINSAMAVMNRISSGIPSKDQVKLDVRRFYVLNELLTIEGDVPKADDLDKVKLSLTSLSVTKQLTELSPTLPARPGRVAFAYQLKVNRKGRP